MRSTNASRRSGLVSHVSAKMSHSFGPREPHSRRNASTCATKLLASTDPSRRNAAIRPVVCAANIFVSALLF